MDGRSSNKGADVAAIEKTERDARIAHRRSKIEANTSRQEVNNRDTADAQHRKLGLAAQRKDSLMKQMLVTKEEGSALVTSIRLDAGSIESLRRSVEGERRQKFQARIQHEMISSNTICGAVEMRWAEIIKCDVPQQLCKELDLQTAACNEILASKDALINEVQMQLFKRDDEFVKALGAQSEEIDRLIKHMVHQFRSTYAYYESELNEIEQALMSERQNLINANKSAIDGFFEKRREMEIRYMESKQIRDQKNHHEIETLRSRDAEEYKELKIKLETKMQTLEQQLEEMRAAYQLNTEKLEYNYRVLIERDLENSSMLSHLKRKVARFKETLSTLIVKYKRMETRDLQKNQELTEDFRRLTKQYKNLQTKYAHFKHGDQLNFQQVWTMHWQELSSRLDKSIKAVQIIYEQQLGLCWKPPSRNYAELLMLHANIKSVREGNVSLSSGSESPLQRNFSSGTEPKTFGHDRVDNSDLYLIKSLADEAGLSISLRVEELLQRLFKGPEQLKADIMLESLDNDTASELERLLYLVRKYMDSNEIPNDKAEDVIKVVEHFFEKPMPLHTNNQSCTEKFEWSNKAILSIDHEFWDKILKIVSPQTVRVMQVLEKALTSYNATLLRRRELHNQVIDLNEQNLQLKKQITQLLGSTANNDILAKSK